MKIMNFITYKDMDNNTYFYIIKKCNLKNNFNGNTDRRNTNG